jgi:iduronate 2-sulfatase
MDLNRRTLLTGLASLPLIGLAACHDRNDPVDNPTMDAAATNLLFIMVDDLNLAIGCYGHLLARTPNLDRLAARGTRFTRAFCPYPLCGPSRAAVLTGVRPEYLGMANNEVCWRERRPHIATLPELARASGFASVRFGKVLHHGLSSGQSYDPTAEGADQPHTFTDPPSWEQEWGGASRVHERQACGPTQIIDGRPFGGTALHTVRAIDGRVLPDAEVADRAVAWLADPARKARRFVCSVGFHKPHVPLIAPERWWGHYDQVPDATIDCCMGPTAQQPADLPPGVLKAVRLHRGATPEQRRHLYRGYLACVSWMDEQLGRVLDALDGSGLSASTLVAFVGDHGYHTGEQAQWDKMMLLDPSLRVPLLLAGPGVARGATANALVESTDVAPTLAGRLGLVPVHRCAGRDLGPWLADPAGLPDAPAFAWLHAAGREGWTVRTATHRYGVMRRDGQPARAYLFDLRCDPHESRNAIADHDQSGVITDLDALLRARYADDAPVVPV